MKKINSKTLITATFLTGLVGLSSVPLGAGAVGYNNNNWQNHNRRDNDRYRNNDWRAEQVARHHHNRHVVRHDRFRNRDNDVIIIIVFVDGCHSYVRERDGAFMGSYYY